MGPKVRHGNRDLVRMAYPTYESKGNPRVCRSGPPPRLCKGSLTLVDRHGHNPEGGSGCLTPCCESDYLCSSPSMGGYSDIKTPVPARAGLSTAGPRSFQRGERKTTPPSAKPAWTRLALIMGARLPRVSLTPANLAEPGPAWLHTVPYPCPTL
jgi:hypothetical protein